MKKFIMIALICVLVCFEMCSLASPVVPAPGEGEESPFAFDADLMRLYIVNTHGASDAMVLLCGGKTMVIDCGEAGYGSLYVKPLLDSLGVEHVDYCFNTHPHDDHINGFLTLFDEVSVDRFYTCFPMNFSEEQINVMSACMAHGIEIKQINNSSDISFGGLSIWLYQDTRFVTPYPANANSASMIMHITFGDSTVMITGDAEKPVFADLYALKGDAIRSDIIKIPHHGYNVPSLEVFGAINPGYAVITNYYNDRIESTDQFLRNNKCPVMYAARGTVELVTDGSVWTIRQLPNV